jgi:hypothetical protein
MSYQIRRRRPSSRRVVGIARPEPCSSSAAVCRTTDTNQSLDSLLCQLNPALKGWCVYFRPGVSSATFVHLSYYTWHRVGKVVASQTPPVHWEGHPPPLLRHRMVASLGG